MKKSVIVTGALGGIGQGLSKVFRERGYEVIGIDIKAQGDIDHCHRTFNSDLALLSNDSVYRNELFQELGKVSENLHVLVNNAAVQLLGRTEQITTSDWGTTLNVNLTAPMLLSQWAIPFLAKNKGSIVNVASIHHELTKPEFVAYATSKSALIGLTKSMAVDLQGTVRVNAISPAAIETPMLSAGFNNDENALDALRKIHPVQRIGYPEEVAHLALFLASNEAKFINGANMTLDGGISSVLKDL